MLHVLGVVLWFSVLGSFGKARALRDARGSSEGRIEPDDGGARLLNDFRLLTAYGQIEKTYEGEDTKKIVRYEISGKDVGEEKFFEVANATGLMAFESRAGERGYPNQDNFMVDIVQNRTSMDFASSLMGLYVIWDGHSKNAHVLTKLLRLVVTKLWRTEVQKLLGLSCSDSSGRENTIKRIARQLFLRSQNEYDNALAKKPNGVSVLGGIDSWGGKGAELLLAGSTMSVVIVDYVDDKVYCANIGDSPVYGRSTEQKQLIPLAESHNVGALAEREAAIGRLKAEGYVYYSTLLVSSPESYVIKYRLMFVKPGGPPAVTGHQYIGIDAHVCADGLLQFDSRMGGLQMAREIGAKARDGGMSYEPSINVYDLKQQPMQYILMASDGLTHVLELATWTYADGLVIENDKHPVEAFGARVPSHYETAFLPMVHADPDNATEVFDTFRKFGEIHERREQYTSQLAEEAIRRVVDEMVQQGDLRGFGEQMLLLSKLGTTSGDDLTTMFIGLPQTAASAAKQREEELSPSSSSHSAARNLTAPLEVLDALKSKEYKSFLPVVEKKCNCTSDDKQKSSDDKQNSSDDKQKSSDDKQNSSDDKQKSSDDKQNSSDDKQKSE